MPPETTNEESPSTEEWLESLSNRDLVDVLIDVNRERSDATFEERALTRAEVLRRLG